MDCSLKAIIFMNIEVIRAVLAVTDGFDFAGYGHRAYRVHKRA